MPEYLAPGVYVEEVDAGTKPIEGVSTSTAGFIGVTQRGPVGGLPVLVTSFAEFRRRFGGYLPETPWGDSRFLAYAVQGFFENEGQRAYIKRVPGDGALPSRLSVQDAIVTRLRSDAAAGATSARLASLRGVTGGTNITLQDSSSGVALSQSRAVTTYDSNTGQVNWAGGLPAGFTAAGTSVTVRPPAGETMRVEARDPGRWGDDIRVMFEYTTPARSPLVSSVRHVLSATMAPQLTLATAPGPGNTTRAILGAGQAALVNVGDWVMITDATNRDFREITSKGPGVEQINWTAGVATDYTANPSTIQMITQARPLTLVAGPDPSVNPTQATLGAGEGVLVRTGDTVEFSAGGNRERRSITGVAGDVISWAVGEQINNDYTVAGSTVRMLTAVRAGDPWLLLPAVTGLLAGDAVTISGAGATENVTVDAGWNAADNPVPLDTGTPTTSSFLEGAAIGLTTAAVRAGTNAVRVQSGQSFYEGALVELDNGTNREFFTINTIAGNDITLSGPTVNSYQSTHFLRLAEFRMSVRYLNEAEAIDQRETFDGLSMSPNAGRRYFATVVNGGSDLVRVIDTAGPAVPFDVPSTTTGSWERLAGGDDGTAPIDDAFVGEDNGPGNRTGIQAMTDIDQVSIIAVPGKTSQFIQNALISHCELLMDRFAVLDPEPGLSIQEVQDFRNRYDTKYAALYYPWVTVRDPLVRDNRNVPPSGHMIGIYARTDVERGVHKAPANEVIRGILGLEAIVNKREQDILNPSPVNVNVLRDFRSSGRGLRVWGARCITSDTSWKYVNVRRLFIFLEESLDEGTQWVVFEPNDEPLWARVRQSVTDFLTRVWRDGALQGTVPEEAFFVRCDRTTMTQDDLDNGRLIMLIGVAAVKPAEFVIIRIGQWAGGTAVAEL